MNWDISQVQMVQPWFVGEDAKQHKAAILSMAIVCEGCSEYIKEKFVCLCGVCVCVCVCVRACVRACV